MIKKEPVIELPIPDTQGLEPVDFNNWDTEREPMPF
jgi:hypothetical protein